MNDDSDLASYLRIEERELEGGLIDASLRTTLVLLTASAVATFRAPLGLVPKCTFTSR
jgi:hypothetical protein